MKAIVRIGLEAGEMQLSDIPVPGIGPDDALIRVKAVGVCGTDYHMFTGHQLTDIPVVVGHEFSGVVEKTGANVRNVVVGDRVVSRLNLGVCGVCRACVSGNPHMCEHRTCPGFKLDGAYAEYIKMDARMLVKLPDSVSFDEGAVAEPMAIVTHALLQRAKVEPEDVVVVFGPGPIGLIALQLARLAGAAKVYMVGSDKDEPMRLPLARKLGADDVFVAGKCDVEQTIRDLNGGNGVDLVIEASGAAQAANTGLRLLRRQGRMCALGIPGTRESVIEWLTAAEKSLQIVFSYSSSPWSWNMVASMLGRKAVDIQSIITHRAPLDKFQDIFAEIAAGNAVKCVFNP